MDVCGLVGEMEACCCEGFFEDGDIVFLSLDSSGQIVAVGVCFWGRDAGQCDEVIECRFPYFFRNGFDAFLAALSVM